MNISCVTEKTLPVAALIHAVSWQQSHRAFCREDCVLAHTPERQQNYLRAKMQQGTRVFLLSDERPAGIVSVTGSLIENLYVLPECQNCGYGSCLLDFAIRECVGAPTLWILDNNDGARRLYERRGFRATGRSHPLSETLSEIEFVLTTGAQP